MINKVGRFFLAKGVKFVWLFHASFYEKISVCNLMGMYVRSQHLLYHFVISNNDECSDAILVMVVLF